MQARLELPPEPTSPRRARHFVTTTLVAAGHDDLVDVATLLVTELVTNAVLHARTDLEVEIADDEGEAGLRFAVYDRSPALPRERHNSLSAATGRGLRLVDTLSGGWHADRTADGKRVWFDLSAHGLAGEPNLDAWDDDAGRVAL
jgi:anti-sigma regulatory factor (Ser/Thr protein kinase)